MHWLEKLLNCRSYYFRQRILPGNINVEIFLNELIQLIENNKNLKLNFSLCNQAYLTAQRCAKMKCISHTLVKNLLYQDKFQAEYIFSSGEPLDPKIIYELLGKYKKTDNELINIRQLGIGAATTIDRSISYYVLRIYPVLILE